MKEQPQEKKTDFSGTPCVQQEADPKEEKELKKKQWPLLVYFLSIMGLTMILFLVLLIAHEYIASKFRPARPDDLRFRLQGMPAPRDEMYEKTGKHLGKHHISAGDK